MAAYLLALGLERQGYRLVSLVVYWVMAQVALRLVNLPLQTSSSLFRFFAYRVANIHTHLATLPDPRPRRESCQRRIEESLSASLTKSDLKPRRVGESMSVESLRSYSHLTFRC